MGMDTHTQVTAHFARKYGGEGPSKIIRRYEVERSLHIILHTDPALCWVGWIKVTSLFHRVFVKDVYNRLRS